MNYKNHVLFGVACWVGTATYLGQAPRPAGICIAGFAALWPDMDHPSSVLGRWIPVLPRLMSHRGPTHSALALMLLAAALWTAAWHFPEWRWELLAIFVGYASAIVGDILTVDGVQFFWPAKVRVRLPILWKSGGWHESVFNTAAILLVVYYWMASRPVLADMQAWFADLIGALEWVAYTVLPAALGLVQELWRYVQRMPWLS